MFSVYIDESGDEGFTTKDGKWLSSEWFLIGGMVVRQTNDLALSRVVNTIKKDILKVRPEKILKPLHFQSLSHKKRKAVVNAIAATGGFKFIIVAIDKQALLKQGPLKLEKQFLYNYVTRFLLERITWLVDEFNGFCDLVFEHRSGTSYADLTSYINGLLIDPRCQIRPGVIASWRALNKSQSKNLQITDVLTGAAYAALESDEFGNVEPSYLLTLSPFLYRRHNNLFSYGLKLFPKSGATVAMQTRFPWLKSL